MSTAEPKLPTIRVGLVNLVHTALTRPPSKKLLVSLITAVLVYVGTWAVTKFALGDPQAMHPAISFAASQAAGVIAGYIVKEWPALLKRLRGTPAPKPPADTAVAQTLPAEEAPPVAEPEDVGVPVEVSESAHDQTAVEAPAEAAPAPVPAAPEPAPEAAPAPPRVDPDGTHDREGPRTVIG